MNRWYAKGHLKYNTPTLGFMILSAGAIVAGLLITLVEAGSNLVREFFRAPGHTDLSSYVNTAFAVAIIFGIVAFIEKITRSDVRSIRYMVLQKLCKIKYGNPLGLQNGQLGPKVKVEKKDCGFMIRIACPSVDFKKVANLEDDISSCLEGKFEGYAVTGKDEDVASRYVDYIIENEVANVENQSIYDSLDDLTR